MESHKAVSPALQPHGWPGLLRWSRPLFAAKNGAGSDAGTPKTKRILIIEDDFLVAMEMEGALHDAGFAIAGVAASGEEAVELAAAQRPDLAVVDIRLAGDRDGVDTAVELLRSHGVRSIFATAHADRETRSRAQAAAPLGWLQKPYTMASLVFQVRDALGKAHGEE